MNTQVFWHWFSSNEKKLRTIHIISESEGNQLLYWFHQHLRYYSPKIGFQLIISTRVKKPSTLSFSTCGDYEVRQLILNLIEVAPKFPNWIISTNIKTLSEEESEYLENEFNLNYSSITSNIKSWIQLIDPSTNKFILGIIMDFPIDKFDPDLLHEVVGFIITDTLGKENFERFIEAFIIHSEPPEDEVLLELKDLIIYLEGY